MDEDIAFATQEPKTPISLCGTPLKELISPLHSRKPTRGLKHLTSQVKSIIQDHEFITVYCIMNSLGDASEDQNAQRRVYDCLNIMEAVGALRRKGKRFFCGDKECVQRKKVFLEQRRRILLQKVQE